jgi:hypothetical protein
LSFSILSLVACFQEKSISSETVVNDPKPSQQIDIFQSPQIKNQSNQAFRASDLKLVGILAVGVPEEVTGDNIVGVLDVTIGVWVGEFKLDSAPP